MQRHRYPAADWNVYVLHVSDGDNFSADNHRTLELIQSLARICSLVGYLEVDPGSLTRSHKLSLFYEEWLGMLPLTDLESRASCTRARPRTGSCGRR